jgi:hypothetical protein
LTLAKPNVTRENARLVERAVVVVMPAALPNKASDRQAVTLRSAVPAVNALLKQSTAELARASDQLVPEVRAHSSSQYVDSDKVSAYFPDLAPQHATILRAAVHAVGLDDDLPRSARSSAISHLVGVNVTSSTRGWHASSGLCDVVVHVPTRDVTHVLHDVLLDIAMYYSWPALVRRYPTTAASAFNGQKVAFAIANKLATAYGHIDPKAGYYSFAASCHLPNGFDYEKYDRLWRQFVTSLLPPEEAIDPGLSAEDQILRHSRFKGELSPRAVEEAVRPLKNGVYFLVRLARMPPRSIDHRRVSQVFGVKSARRGSLAVVHHKKLDDVARYFDYLQLFKFVVRR